LAELFLDLTQGSRQSALLVLVHYHPHVLTRAPRAADNCISSQYYSTGQVARLPHKRIFLRQQAQKPRQSGLDRLSAHLIAVTRELLAHTEKTLAVAPGQPDRTDWFVHGTTARP